MNVYATAGALLLTGLLSTQAFAEHKYSDWGPAVNLGCGTINSPSNDFGSGEKHHSGPIGGLPNAPHIRLNAPVSESRTITRWLP